MRTFYLLTDEGIVGAVEGSYQRASAQAAWHSKRLPGTTIRIVDAEGCEYGVIETVTPVNRGCRPKRHFADPIQ